MHTTLRILVVTLTAFVGVAAQAQTPRSVPTNSLPFHLQSLGRTPTKAEREVIEVALLLMQRHHCRTDYPLRSIKYDDTKKEWVLFFNEGKPDAAFWVFLPHKDASSFEVQNVPTKWRTKFPSDRKKGELSTSHAQSTQLPDVITMPLGFASSPQLTQEQVASLAMRLSQQHFGQMADLEASLPRGSRLMPVCYSTLSAVDANGRAKPYNETISVCRLSEDRDIVIIEDDSSGVDLIQKWFIRDLSKANRR